MQYYYYSDFTKLDVCLTPLTSIPDYARNKVLNRHLDTLPNPDTR